MAIIDFLKNNGAVPAPVKTPIKQGVDGKSFELVLSETGKVASTQAIARNDSVVLTGTVTKISRSVESSQQSNAHIEKLDRIKRAIDSGTYEINANRIATKMMQDAILWDKA